MNTHAELLSRVLDARSDDVAEFIAKGQALAMVQLHRRLSAQRLAMGNPLPDVDGIPDSQEEAVRLAGEAVAAILHSENCQPSAVAIAGQSLMNTADTLGWLEEMERDADAESAAN